MPGCGPLGRLCLSLGPRSSARHDGWESDHYQVQLAGILITAFPPGRGRPNAILSTLTVAVQQALSSSQLCFQTSFSNILASAILSSNMHHILSRTAGWQASSQVPERSTQAPAEYATDKPLCLNSHHLSMARSFYTIYAKLDVRYAVSTSMRKAPVARSCSGTSRRRCSRAAVCAAAPCSCAPTMRSTSACTGGHSQAKTHGGRGL